MLIFTEKTDPGEQADASVALPLELRIKSRMRITLDDGRDAGIVLPRGESLKDGDRLISENGEMLRISAAKETLSCVYCEDALLFARACYHLGNRHVPLQITSNCLSYRNDHVLDDMLRGLGLAVTLESRPFEPESGAYGSTAHAHHAHGHHDHEH